MRFQASVILAAVAMAFLAGEASAWGGLFNRFNPSMLSNLGYGGSYGRELYGVSDKALESVSCNKRLFFLKVGR